MGTSQTAFPKEAAAAQRACDTPRGAEKVFLLPFIKLNSIGPGCIQLHIPLSASHSGDEAPLHSLRGPRMGKIAPNSERDTGLGRSRVPGRVAGGNGVGTSLGLVGPELKLDTD